MRFHAPLVFNRKCLTVFASSDLGRGPETTSGWCWSWSWVTPLLVYISSIIKRLKIISLCFTISSYKFDNGCHLFALKILCHAICDVAVYLLGYIVAVSNYGLSLGCLGLDVSCGSTGVGFCKNGLSYTAAFYQLTLMIFHYSFI